MYDQMYYPYQPQPQQNPYQARLNSMQNPMLQKYSIIHVNGRKGAEAFRMLPNSECILLDDTKPLIWLCQSDGAGYHELTPFAITPIHEPTPQDISSFEERLARLEAKLNEQPSYAAVSTANVEKPAEPKQFSGHDATIQPVQGSDAGQRP